MISIIGVVQFFVCIFDFNQTLRSNDSFPALLLRYYFIRLHRPTKTRGKRHQVRKAHWQYLHLTMICNLTI